MTFDKATRTTLRGALAFAVLGPLAFQAIAQTADCTVDQDFEASATGWINSTASTCTTGDYVLGNPTEVVNGGVTTQVGGSSSGTNSLFTATNSSAGVDDVDGGNCILESPTYSVSDESTLSVKYFHGQRDAGDDSSGDFFFLEYSTNGGITFNTLASNGDSTSNAAWTISTAEIPASSTVQLRVQCSDGAGNGDLVECGIDDVAICRVQTAGPCADGSTCTGTVATCIGGTAVCTGPSTIACPNGSGTSSSGCACIGGNPVCFGPCTANCPGGPCTGSSSATCTCKSNGDPKCQ